MARIGIIACQVYARELAHILDNHSSIDKVIIINNPEGKEFASMLSSCDYTMIRDPAFIKRVSNCNEVLVSVLPIGLHLDINDLEYECNEMITSLKDMTKGILLLYGLCGKGLESVICRDDVPLFFPSDEEGIVDDCVCSLLGRGRYFKELKNNGSFFMTVGFVRYRNQMLQRINERSSGEYTSSQTQIMLEESHYKRSLIVHEGIENSSDIIRAEELSCNLELPVEHTTGSLYMLEDALDRTIEACL